jgi:hypothetical protein
MPAPIVPINSRHDSMKPREIGNSIKDLNYFPTPNNLNIYGINPKSIIASRDGSRTTLGIK